MADTDGARDERSTNLQPVADATTPAQSAPTPPGPSVAQGPFLPSFPPLMAYQPSALERWRVSLIVALVVVFIVFGALDISSILLRPTQDTGTTRPLVVNAQVVADATPATHPDLGLAPDTLTISCGKAGNITITNKSARPLQWSVIIDNDALTFAADSPHTGLLAPGQDIKLSVMALGQTGAYLLHVTDDHGESADVPIEVTC